MTLKIHIKLHVAPLNSPPEPRWQCQSNPAIRHRGSPASPPSPSQRETLQLHNLHPVCAWQLSQSLLLCSLSLAFIPLPNSNSGKPLFHELLHILSGEHHSTLRQSYHQQETFVVWRQETFVSWTITHTLWWASLNTKTVLLPAGNLCGLETGNLCFMNYYTYSLVSITQH